MKKILITLLFLFLYSVGSIAKPLDLTKEEKGFIKDNPVVSIGMMPDFTPFSYYIEGEPVGFEHDLLNLISQKTGLKFEKHIDKWTTIYNSFKNKEIDMISSISYKKYREPFTIFTSPYYNIPIMIFVKDNFGEYNGLKSLTGKKVGVLKDVFYIKELEDLGSMNLIFYDSYDDLTKDLVFGKIDALMQNLPNINHLIKKNLYNNIKLASELVLPNTNREDLRFGIQPGKSLLSSILQKSLTSISKREMEELSDKWIGSIKEYPGGHIDLNDAEKAYINTHTIKYCINPSGLPFEGLNEDGEHVGMSSDYYRLFEQMLSAKFELVKTKNWNQSVEFIQQKKCDMLALGMETPERKKYLNFTSHYLDVPLVVATRVDVPFINQILDLEGEKIGIIKGDAFVKILRGKYPSLKIVEVDDIYDGLDQVKNGQLFAYIDTLASIGYEFQSKYFGELKIAGKISENLRLSIAVRKDDITLLGILQKVVNNITNERHRKIFTKWIPIKYEQDVNYKIVWQIVLAIVIFLALMIYWNRKITKANTLLKQAQKDIEEKNKELNRLALTDNLTTLFNRRKLEELIQAEIDKGYHVDNSFCLSILDIDHFKEVNDKYGHQRGDSVLVEIASVLKDSLRITDYVGRYGGEEFIIIFPESSIEDVKLIIEGVRLKIAQYDFEGIEHKTASFGLTAFKAGDTIETVVKRADNALYEAKESGRNRVVVN
ncbi:MAG: transporter substrate-binding domain-containing protein [Gammaproteobacteria bacterium]|nr:transporter substrate-binding domain-containing protein [Gammaproteobacteria bacterium]MBU2240756.1 transporter substrate-binding domain-containing protein [Gammaproteobacteria bacterium]MBU2317172.1 transporter substrate-binding domain-containing protein [Gammaproteobacteria bacterium]MBU2415286.1 transporter substrate-binding domain-containing protein [Gammaproteobacteria bacterium]